MWNARLKVRVRVAPILVRVVLSIYNIVPEEKNG